MAAAKQERGPAPGTSAATAGPSAEETIPSACYMCYNGCTIRVRVRDGVVARIEGLPEGWNRGGLCPRGNAGIMHLYDPNRIKSPLRRTNPQKGIGIDPGFVEVSWEEALSEVAQKLIKLKAENPPGLIMGTMDLLRTNAFLAFAYAFGAPQMGLAGSSGGVSCGNGIHMLGEIIHGSFSERIDWEHCNYAMLWGCNNAFESFPDLTLDMRRCADARVRGMKLVVVDPRFSAAAAKADQWVPIRPGTDAALALGMVNLLINELNLYDAHFIKRQTNGPYLIGPDGYYVRDRDSGKPLVWDAGAQRARPYNDELLQDFALEGEYEVNGVVCKPAFQLLKERVKEYTVERVAEITTVPPEVTRRLAQQWGEEARIGSTIVLQGRALPWRPAALNFYRGVHAHKHSAMNALSLLTLAMVVGAIDVPGGVVRNDIGLSFSGEPTPIAPGPDGLVMPQVFLFRPPVPFSHPPKESDLKEWFPLALDQGHVAHLTAASPQKFGLSTERVNIFMLVNPLFTTGDPKALEAGLRNSYNVVCDVVLSETAQLADVVLPEPTYLERYAVWGSRHSGYTGYAISQPALPPLHHLPDFIDILIDLANRAGILHGANGMNYWLNTFMKIQEPYKLDLNTRYCWTEVIDRVLKTKSQGQEGLDSFKTKGIVARWLGPEKYQPYRDLRLPLYVELLKKTGDELKKKFAECRVEERTGIPWDFSDYDALPSWKPAPIHRAPPEFDMFAVSYKSVINTFGRGVNNPWIVELMEKDPYVLKLWINIETARRKGIKDGDEVWVESQVGKVKGKAALSEGIHPECIGFGSILGHWADHSIARGRGAHFNSLCPVSFEATDMVSAGLQNVTARVKIYKA